MAAVGDSFGGILPAVVTPFDATGRFHPEALERLLARLYRAGVHGVYVCGTTGEGMQQPAAQRRAVAEAVVGGSPPGKLVVVHVGASAAAEALELARHAGRIGATAVSSLPPIGGFSFPEIRAYYARLAEESGIPLLVYYYPELSGARLDAGQLLELCSLPGVAGVKLTDFDLFRLWMLKREGLAVFNGRDEVLPAGLLMGADGAIGSFYNLLPEDAVRVLDLARAGDWEGAREAFGRIGALVRVVSRYPLLAAIKQLLRWSGLDCGECLLPRLPLSRGDADRLREQIERAGLGEILSGRERA